MDKTTRQIRFLLSEQEYFSARVSGSCMTPLITDGALVKIQRHRVYFPGDIVTFMPSKGGISCHRFLGYARYRGAWLVLTRADNAANPDGMVESSRILGKVVSMDGLPVKATMVSRLRAVTGWGWHLFRLLLRKFKSKNV